MQAETNLLKRITRQASATHSSKRLLDILAVLIITSLFFLLVGGFPPYAWRLFFQMLSQMPVLLAAHGLIMLLELVGLLLLSVLLLFVWGALLWLSWQALAYWQDQRPGLFSFLLSRLEAPQQKEKTSKSSANTHPKEEADKANPPVSRPAGHVDSALASPAPTRPVSPTRVAVPPATVRQNSASSAPIPVPTLIKPATSGQAPTVPAAPISTPAQAPTVQPDRNTDSLAVPSAGALPRLMTASYKSVHLPPSTERQPEQPAASQQVQHPIAVQSSTQLVMPPARRAASPLIQRATVSQSPVQPVVAPPPEQLTVPTQPTKQRTAMQSLLELISTIPLSQKHLDPAPIEKSPASPKSTDPQPAIPQTRLEQAPDSQISLREQLPNPQTPTPEEQPPAHQTPDREQLPESQASAPEEQPPAHQILDLEHVPELQTPTPQEEQPPTRQTPIPEQAPAPYIAAQSHVELASTIPLVGHNIPVPVPPERAIPNPAREKLATQLVVSTGLDVGLKRKGKPNEDSLLALQNTRMLNGKLCPFGLFVVADGMGGHSNGQEASQLVIQSLSKTVASPALYGSMDENYAKLLADGVHQANQEIYQRNLQTRRNMGTTIVAALIVDTTVYVVSAGDSRMYLYRAASGLTQVTRDHSTVANLVETGQITPEEIYTHPRRNEIYRCLGHHPEEELDEFIMALQPEDVLLLCSDGLWEMVRDTHIEEIIASTAHQPKQTSTALVQAALDGGGKDNISAVVVYAHGPL